MPLTVLVELISFSDHARMVSQEAVKTVAASNLPLVALVNNAGISTRSPLEGTPMKVVRGVFEVNLFGLIMTTQAFLPLLRKNQGRIVNVGSVAGLIAADGSSIYSGTKFAVEALSDSLRREMSPFGVSVSVVEPVRIRRRPIGTSLKVHKRPPGS